jgi:hypothetical protein
MGEDIADAVKVFTECCSVYPKRVAQHYFRVEAGDNGSFVTSPKEAASPSRFLEFL